MEMEIQTEENIYTPTPCRDYKKINGNDLNKWCNSIGGVSRVCSILGYSVRQFERYFADSTGETIPDVIKMFVKLSDENAILKQENSRLKRLNREL